MNPIVIFLQSIFAAIAKRTAEKTLPFIEEEVGAMVKLGGATLAVWSDSEMPAAEKSDLYKDGVAGLKTFVEAAKAKGSDVAGDTLEILSGAIGDEITSALGVGQ
ncbi:MAG: hypothetical protein JSS75_07130 [Bacteroidetes bacterium]|nr:hypothetical protein [Bacteroidota bacterium]